MLKEMSMSLQRKIWIGLHRVPLSIRCRSVVANPPVTYPITTSGTIHSDMDHYPKTLRASLESIFSIILEHREATLVNTSLEECKRRDEVIRTFFTECFWREEQYASFKLARSWFVSQNPENNIHDVEQQPYSITYTLHPLSQLKPYQDAYPYVFDYEWEILPPLYKGELLFSDGDNHFLAVEVQPMSEKFVVHGNRRNSRVRLRAKRMKLARSMNVWHWSQPQVKCTEGILMTNEGFAVAKPLVRSY